MSSTTAAEHHYQLKIYDQRSLLTSLDISRPVVVGRQRQGEGPPFTCTPTADGQRLVIAPSQEVTISREHLRIVPRGPTQIELTNINEKNIVGLAEGQLLQPGQTRVLDLPAMCVVGHRVLRIETPPPPAEENLQSLARPAPAPGQNSSIISAEHLQPLGSVRGGARLTDADLLAWLQASMDVFQCASSSVEFLPKSTEAALRMVGLDATAVVLRQDGDWKIASIAHRPDRVDPETWKPSRSMLDRVLVEPRTFFNVPRMVGIEHTALLIRDGDDWKVSAAEAGSGTADARQTMMPRVTSEYRTLAGPARSTPRDSGRIGMQSLVATPILDSAGKVIGVLYGERRAYERDKLKEPITELEAKLFELLAYGVASGLARMEQERKLIAERVRFEQFFTPELARLMQEQGEAMMAARDAAITVLFCDIKAFSRISADKGAAIAMEWLRDVLSMLSDCVAEFDGVLVDYSGDALEAIWGAPLTSDDHAARACSCALRMRGGLPEINQRWQTRMGEPTEISIGINTGLAQVGNIGSRRKFKYGALGTTVNLASRVQGATKHLGLPLLVTQSTATRLPPSFQTRRLCQVRTINIDEPVELYELSDGQLPRWPELKKRYEEAFGLFEQAKFFDAMALLGGLVAEFPQDEPTRRLLQRNVQCLSQPVEKFDRVWTFDSK